MWQGLLEARTQQGCLSAFFVLQQRQVDQQLRDIFAGSATQVML